MKESTLLPHALSNASRMAVIELLLKKTMIAGDLARAVGMPDHGMSQQLTLMTKWGIIEFEREGNFKKFSIKYDVRIGKRTLSLNGVEIKL